MAHTYGAPGTYTVAVGSTDVLGNATSTSATVSIAAKAPGITPVAPRITAARVSPSRFRVSRRATAISARARAPQGTSFHFTLSETASLQIAFLRSAGGLRSGRGCVSPSARLRRRHARRCKRAVALGTLTRVREGQGADSVAFSGRIGTKPLPPGAYTAILTASADGLSSAPVKLSLTVVR